MNRHGRADILVRVAALTLAVVVISALVGLGVLIGYGIWG